jgi:hypothetical protein
MSAVTGNRQLNAAIHRIALTLARIYRLPVSYSTGAMTTAMVAWKPCASSNAASPTSSTGPCSPTKPSRSPALLDIGAASTTTPRDSPSD